MYTIWFERPLPPAHSHLLQGVARVAGPATATPGDPFSDLPRAEAIIAAGSLSYDAVVMDRAPELRAICRAGIGYDNVDVQAASDRGVVVCNTPDAPTVSTAEHAVALLLAVAKQINRLDQKLRRGSGSDYFDQNDGLELCGLRLGLVGLGRIGSRVARVAASLGMEVWAFDPQQAAEAFTAQDIHRAATLDELLAGADVVSLHLPLNSHTRHLLDADRLAQMKPGAILINTARGPLVDERALQQALAEGRLRGAGLDVFQTEPPPADHPLLQLDNVVVTPHIASATRAGKARLWTAAITQAIDVLEGRPPAHPVRP